MVVEGCDVCQRELGAGEHPVHEKVQAVADLTGGVRTSGSLTTGYFGAWGSDGRTVVQRNFAEVVTNGACQYLQNGPATKQAHNAITVYLNRLQLRPPHPGHALRGLQRPRQALLGPSRRHRSRRHPFTCQDDPDKGCRRTGMPRRAGHRRDRESGSSRHARRLPTSQPVPAMPPTPQHRPSGRSFDAGRDSTAQPIPMQVEAGTTPDPDERASAPCSESAEIVVECPPFGCGTRPGTVCICCCT
ncbi:hypothetical protein SCHAM137S_02145 [Streptomyces chartreusis]